MKPSLDPLFLSAIIYQSMILINLFLSEVQTAFKACKRKTDRTKFQILALLLDQTNWKPALDAIYL